MLSTHGTLLLAGIPVSFEVHVVIHQPLRGKSSNDGLYDRLLVAVQFVLDGEGFQDGKP